MGIHATVVGVSYLADGTARLNLEPDHKGGETELIVVEPPDHLDGIIGTKIWANAQYIFVGQVLVAERLGVNTIRFTKSRKSAA